MVKEELFKEFLEQTVKVPYNDGGTYKIARGKLTQIDEGFIKIEGQLGTVIINIKNVERIALAKNV